MNESGERDARGESRIGDRGPATIGVPAENFIRKVKASYSIDTGGQLHAAGRHLHNVRAAGRVEHIRAVEEAREGLTVLAVTDEAKGARGYKFVHNAAHMAASALKGKVEWHGHWSDYCDAERLEHSELSRKHRRPAPTIWTDADPRCACHSRNAENTHAFRKTKKPRGDRGAFCLKIVRGCSVLCRPGSDLLFQALRLSTIGAEDFDGRVRDGIG
jgi:hypothetical protein